MKKPLVKIPLKELDKCSKEMISDIRKLKIKIYDKEKKLRYVDELLKAYEYEETSTL